MDWLLALFGIWTWFIIAAVLLILELLVLGIFFVWLGLAAVVVGVLHLILPLGWQAEVILFGVLSAVLLLVARPWLSKRQALQSDRPNLNQRMYDYVGKAYFLDEPLLHGRGKLKIDDTLWEIEGPDTPQGTWVKVTAVDGLKLKVKPVGPA